MGRQLPDTEIDMIQELIRCEEGLFSEDLAAGLHVTQVAVYFVKEGNCTQPNEG